MTRSLSARMAIAFSALLAGMGVFMVLFFPAHMRAQGERSTETRALAIAQVMSTAIAPAIEFDDPDYAKTILSWLESMPDARFGFLDRTRGGRVAAWHDTQIPSDHPWPASPGARFEPHLLVVTSAVKGKASADGTLYLGFSLDRLDGDSADATRTVLIVSVVVVLIGVLATAAAASLLVRPIRRLTVTARRIASGELPPELPALGGSDEIASLADALREMLVRVSSVSQQELLRASRHAGMAEVATGVLHNVGNVLNSVNVSVELLRERVMTPQSTRVRQLHDILTAADPRAFDADRLAAVTRFVSMTAGALDREREASLRDLDNLRGHIDHIKRVVSMQNAYARHGGVIETTRVRALVEEAVEIACPVNRRAGLTLALDIADDCVAIDRHRVLQILVNLVANARDAVAGATNKRITVATHVMPDRVAIAVADSGVGFSSETATHLFGAGFTTKPHGHGYGLHSSSMAARQLGGELVATSAGLGCGATFTLTLPIGEVKS